MNRLTKILKILAKDAVVVIIALIFAFIVLGALHKYFPNNFVGRFAEYIAQKARGEGTGL